MPFPPNKADGKPFVPPRVQNYLHPLLFCGMMAGEGQAMQPKEYQALIEAITEIIDEGVQVVGRDGRTPATRRARWTTCP